MPNCEYFEELCSSSLDGELTRAQKRELEAHLAECPACAAYLEDLKLIRTAWGDLKEPLPEQLHEKIMSGILEEAQSKVVPMEKKKRRPPVFTMIAAAAACVMLVMSGAVNDLLGGVKVENSSTGVADTATGGAAMEEIPESEQSDTMLPETTEIVPSTIEPAQSAQPQPEPETDSQTQETYGRQAPPPVEESTQQEETTAGAGSSAASSSSGNAPATASAGVPQMNNRLAAVNGAEKQAISLPENLRTHQFSGCYVAVGSGDVSVLKDASLLEKIDNVYYFEIRSSVSSMDSCLKTLQENGFETALRRDVGVTISDNAESVLLILVLQE